MQLSLQASSRMVAQTLVTAEAAGKHMFATPSQVQSPVHNAEVVFDAHTTDAPATTLSGVLGRHMLVAVSNLHASPVHVAISLVAHSETASDSLSPMSGFIKHIEVVSIYMQPPVHASLDLVAQVVPVASSPWTPQVPTVKSPVHMHPEAMLHEAIVIHVPQEALAEGALDSAGEHNKPIASQEHLKVDAVQVASVICMRQSLVKVASLAVMVPEAMGSTPAASRDLARRLVTLPICCPLRSVMSTDPLLIVTSAPREE
mmetsp:Transcript_3956/g.4464  ORF Transcript_3956/g.4464 Transcript_3956/m.4464 type:complete len:259 (-) Transcript_3956:740-1516(-)